MKQLPKKDFVLFKKECLRLQKEWGLAGWDLFFAFEKLDGKCASTSGNVSSHQATISLASEVPEENWPDKDILKHAKHEMLHVLLWRMSSYGYSRFVNEEELKESEHELIMQLMKLL